MREYPCKNPSELCKKTTIEECKICYEISQNCSCRRRGNELADIAAKKLTDEINKLIKESKDA